MSKQRSVRKRRAVDEDETVDAGDAAADQLAPSAQDIKLLQKHRQRRTGVDATSLALADKGALTASTADEDAEEGPDVLKAAFNRERQRQTGEDDPQMKRYVEEQLARRLGRPLPDDAAAASAGPKTLAELALEGAGPRQRPVDTELGAAFVAGVTEVALGVEHKLRSIEATEAAKTALLARGGTAARRLGGGGVVDEADEGGGGGGGGGALRRGQYPVHFGRQDPREAERLAGAAARRARMRAHFEEKQRRKDDGFSGW